MSASVSRPVACAIRIPRRSRGYCRSRAEGAGPRGGGTDRSYRQRRRRLEGWANAWAWASSAVAAAIASTAADGDLVNCINQGYTGVQQDGGYAEVMIAKASGLIAVPDDLSSVDAAPLLCARSDDIQRAAEFAGARRGTWSPFSESGGLGHLGVQYGRRMGFEVVAIDRGGGDTGRVVQETRRAPLYRQLQHRCLPRRCRRLAAHRWFWLLPQAARRSPQPLVACGAAAW